MRAFALMMLVLGLACVAHAADDPDPEPPGAASRDLRELQGKWVVSRMTWKGQDRKPPGEMTYTFKGNKLTSGMAGKNGVELTIKINTTKRPYTMESTSEKTKATQVKIFKIEKGELFIAMSKGKGTGAAKDFSGEDAPVLVLTKKKE